MEVEFQHAMRPFISLVQQDDIVRGSLLCEAGIVAGPPAQYPSSPAQLCYVGWACFVGGVQRWNDTMFVLRRSTVAGRRASYFVVRVLAAFAWVFADRCWRLRLYGRSWRLH